MPFLHDGKVRARGEGERNLISAVFYQLPPSLPIDPLQPRYHTRQEEGALGTPGSFML